MKRLAPGMEAQIELCGGEKTNEWRGVPASRHKGWGNRRLVVRRSACVAVSLVQMDENSANDFVLDQAERTAAITFQRVDLIDPFKGACSPNVWQQPEERRCRFAKRLAARRGGRSACAAFPKARLS